MESKKTVGKHILALINNIVMHIEFSPTWDIFWQNLMQSKLCETTQGKHSANLYSPKQFESKQGVKILWYICAKGRKYYCFKYFTTLIAIRL